MKSMNLFGVLALALGVGTHSSALAETAFIKMGGLYTIYVDEVSKTVLPGQSAVYNLCAVSASSMVFTIPAYAYWPWDNLGPLTLSKGQFNLIWTIKSGQQYPSQ